MENLVMFDGFVKVKSNIDKKYSNIKLPWVEKYRPKTSDEILLDPFVKIEIDKFLENKSYITK